MLLVCENLFNISFNSLAYHVRLSYFVNSVVGRHKIMLTGQTYAACMWNLRYFYAFDDCLFVIYRYFIILMGYMVWQSTGETSWQDVGSVLSEK